MIQPERIVAINDTENRQGDYVLYWMQAAQRIQNNHALEFATQLANKRACGLVVCFVLMPSYPSANKRHYRFMLQGLTSLKKGVEALGATFVIDYGEPDRIIETLSNQAIALVMDDAITRPIRHLKDGISSRLTCPIYKVETNVIVPVRTAYPKEAYAAYAIRNALNKKLASYALGFNPSTLKHPVANLSIQNQLKLIEPEYLLRHYYGHLPDLQDAGCQVGGMEEAMEKLEDFVEHGLKHYEKKANDPSVEGSSKLSAYLHFGMISPITIYERVKESGILSGGFVEQLFIRRELAYNFVYYNDRYDVDLKSILPNWAQKELEDHKEDFRNEVYSSEQLELGQTHDPYWNAAQLEMVRTGFMHNTMRMYWGKKVIEWTATYEDAFNTMIELNDKYAIDGRDPNGYAGIAWCFGKHDRPFSSRSIFGKIRYMNDKGLLRKYKMEGYLRRIHELGGSDASL